jgi:NAD+ synthase (glutamine-hydrolysing)
MIRIALAQINSTVGDLKGNSAKIIANIRKAKQNRVDLVVFPELALTGYPPEDLLHKSNFVSRNQKLLDSIRKASKGLVSLVGFVDRKKGLIYNSCALIQDQKIKDIYRKIALPNYGVFDEKRYFTEADSLSLYSLDNYKFALSICEDVWEKGFVKALKKKKLDFVINISASPFHLGKVLQREKALSYAARELNCFVFYCNLVGGQDELVFDGTSKVISPQGKIISWAKRFSEDFLIFDLNRNKNYRSKRVLIKEEEETFSALRLGLADYVKKNGFKKVVVGLSGGIDSAVVVSLAAMALGSKNVHAIIMPSSFTSQATLADAKKICRNLGIKYSLLNINRVFQSYLKTLKPHFVKNAAGKTKENLQARIRGNILMAFSNKFGYLVLNTGNKSELSCGYCTLYGDMVGGFGVLKDVPKLLVYKLADQINKISPKAVIPDSVLKRAPSAELRPNQKDTDSLPAYKLLDPILKLYVESDLSLGQITERGWPKKLASKIIKMVDSNEYKRRQAPVGIKITPRAFGRDRRMPITNRFY